MKPPITEVTAVIADDESLARTYLKEMLLAHPQVTVIAECSNGFEAVETVIEKRPDVLFLDIDMPKLNGFEVLEALEPELPRVIFITAYDEYALMAFEVHAVDYLLKPFSKDRLEKAVSRLFEGPASPMPRAREIAAERPPSMLPSPRIVVREGGTVTVIAPEDVDYISAEGDYVSIHAYGRAHLKLDTISAMDAMLSKGSFVRVHRSTLVNLARLDRVDTSSTEGKDAVLKDGTRLAVSRSGYKLLMERLRN